MQIGNHGHSHAQGVTAGRMMARAEGANTEAATKGQRIVARNDKDDDGMLSVSELKDTKLGRRMSVERFGSIDTNGDEKLDASELDAAKRARHGSAMKESVLNAQLADHLTEKVEIDKQPDVATLVMQRLDGDDSGGLNSEEIAGTRLAEIIGSEFYQIDADKNGALDKAELGGFIANYLTGSSAVAAGEPETDDEVAEIAQTTEAVEAAEDAEDAVDATSDVEGTIVAPNTDAIPQGTDAPEPDDSAPLAVSSAAAYANNIRMAFEAALKILQDGPQQNPYMDVTQ
jgi:hypothetical protein